MSLRYALLALLTVEPMTGYDVYKHFESSVGYVWHAPDSQIYPELRKMEKAGLLESSEIPWGKRGKKTEYSITADGRTAFRDWINETLEYSRERDPVHLKAAYMEWAEPEAARAQMQAHIDYYTSRLKQWTEMVEDLTSGTNDMLNRRLSAAPPEEHPRIAGFKTFTYRGLIARAEAEIAWAHEGLALIQRLYPKS